MDTMLLALLGMIDSLVGDNSHTRLCMMMMMNKLPMQQNWACYASIITARITIVIIIIIIITAITVMD